MITDQSILRHLERQQHRSAGFKQLVREMGLRGAERQQLADLLQALVKSGRLIETGRDRYTVAEHDAARQNLIAGRLTMHRDGYGFVIPNAAQRNTLSGDIFIPPAAIGSAMHGDQVLVELGRTKEDGRAEGRILRVLSRGNPSVVGTFHYGSRHNYVTPMDEKITQEVIIPRGMEWPSGTEQAEPETPGRNPLPRSAGQAFSLVFGERVGEFREKTRPQEGSRARSRSRRRSPPPRVGRPRRPSGGGRDHGMAFANAKSPRACGRNLRL